MKVGTKVDCSVHRKAENLAYRKVGMYKHLADLKAGTKVDCSVKTKVENLAKRKVAHWVIQMVGLKADHWVIQMERRMGFQMALMMPVTKMRLLSKNQVSYY